METQSGVLAARVKVGRKKKTIPTVQVRLAVDVARSARIVAAYRDQEPGDFLSDFLRPILAKMQAEEASKAAKPKPKGGDS